VTVADTFRLSDHDLYLFREGTHRRLYYLNRYRYYRQEPALHELDFDYTGFEWMDRQDADAPVPAHGKFQSLTLTLPPLATLFFTNAERGGSR
jgi:1,4-alpha-glucan branching enzyme